MKHIISVSRNSLLVVGLFFSSLHPEGIQEWIVKNPCKAFVAGVITAYGVYYGLSQYGKKPVKVKLQRPGKVKINTNTVQKETFVDEYSGVTANAEDSLFEDAIFEYDGAVQEDNFFAIVNDEYDGSAVVFVEDEYVALNSDIFVTTDSVGNVMAFADEYTSANNAMTFTDEYTSANNVMALTDEYTSNLVEFDNEGDIAVMIDQEIALAEELVEEEMLEMFEEIFDRTKSKDITFARTVTDYSDLLQYHQDDEGNTFLHDFVAQSILLTEQESYEKAPEMVVKFYQKIYQDTQLTHDDVSEIVAKLTYGHPDSNDTLYAQLLFLRNNEGKTAKELAAQGTTEWSKQLFEQLNEEEEAVLLSLQNEGVII